MGCSNSNEVAPIDDPSPKSDVSNSGSASIQTFRQDFLKWHNYYRAMHHAPPMTNDPELDKMAQAYADKMAKTGNFAHAPASERNGAGENLFNIGYTSITNEILQSEFF